MEITPEIQLAQALFWTLSAVVGLIVTLPVLQTAYLAYVVLRREADEADVVTMIRANLQSDALRLAMHLSFFVLGLARLLGPPFVGLYVADPVAYWLGSAALMLVPCELIAVTLIARSARLRATRRGR